MRPLFSNERTSCNSIMIFDTHAHYDDERYNLNLDYLADEMRVNGVGAILTCSTDYKSCKKSIEIAEKFNDIYAAVGVYPHETHKAKWDKQKLINLANHPKVVAIGEIGLDYYYDDAPKQLQKEWLINQIEVANELQLPISFHDRDAHKDTLEILKQYRPKGVLHCFSGSAEMAREIIKLGMYVGIGGVVTFKNARVIVDVVKSIALDRILIETDAPYMAPVPMRGKTNRSDYLVYVAEKIAEIKGVTTQQVIDGTFNNAKQLFNKCMNNY